LSADAAVTELTNTNVSEEKLKVAETAAVNAGDAPSDAATGPSILVLNDLWRYVPAYFQAVDPVQPRSEAGRRLLERRWRQIERRQQQQRKSAVTTSEVGENHRGTLPVDQLLAYITDSATNNSMATSTSGLATLGKGRRKKKQPTRNSDAVAHDNASSSKHASTDDADRSRGGSEHARKEVKNREPKSDVTATEAVNDGDFVVVGKGRKQKPPAARRPTRLEMEVPLGGSRRYKATFCDSLDEFSLQDDKIKRSVADRTKDNKSTCASTVIDECSVSAATFEPTESPQTLTLLTKTIASSQRLKLDNPTTSFECDRPITLRYNDVVKGIRSNWQAKPTVVDEVTEATKCHHEQSLSSPASSIDCVQTRNSPTTLNESNGQDMIHPMTDVHPVNVSATPLDRNSLIHRPIDKHVAHRKVETVSCSTQTSNVEMPPRHSTPDNHTTIIDVTGNENLLQGPNPVEFLYAGSEKTDDFEVQQDGKGLSFGSFDGSSKSRDSDKAITKSTNVSRCSDAATSSIKVSPVISSSSSLYTKSATAVSHSRRITPLCRTTGSSSLATGAPVGIVPPIMHIDTASGDIEASADNSTREEVSHYFSE